MNQRKVKVFFGILLITLISFVILSFSFFISGVTNSGKDKSIGLSPPDDERFGEEGRQGRKGSAWTWASEGLEWFFRGGSQRHHLLICGNWLGSCSREIYITDDFPHHTENGGYLPFFVSASLSLTQVTNMQRNLMTGNSLLWSSAAFHWMVFLWLVVILETNGTLMGIQTLFSKPNLGVQSPAKARAFARKGISWTEWFHSVIRLFAIKLLVCSLTAVYKYLEYNRAQSSCLHTDDFLGFSDSSHDEPAFVLNNFSSSACPKGHWAQFPEGMSS